MCQQRFNFIKLYIPFIVIEQELLPTDKRHQSFGLLIVFAGETSSRSLKESSRGGFFYAQTLVGR